MADIERTLIEAEHARRRYLVEDDADALEAGMADIFHYAHINGLVEDKHSFLARIRAHKVKTHAMSASNLKVMVRPNGHALMTGESRIEFEWTDGSAKGLTETLFLSVWEQTDGEWKISAYASSPLPGR